MAAPDSTRSERKVARLERPSLAKKCFLDPFGLSCPRQLFLQLPLQIRLLLFERNVFRDIMGMGTTNPTALQKTANRRYDASLAHTDFTKQEKLKHLKCTSMPSKRPRRATAPDSFQRENSKDSKRFKSFLRPEQGPFLLGQATNFM